MAKFIEVHRITRVDGETFLVLQNLDDVSVACGGITGATVALRRAPDLMGSSAFSVAETYEQLRLMIGAAQGGIPMDVDKGGSYGWMIT